MLRIRGMTVADIPLGMRLKEQAGWNQVEGDWRRLLDLQPDGCFVAELDDVPAGTVTTCRFGPGGMGGHDAGGQVIPKSWDWSGPHEPRSGRSGLRGHSHDPP